MASSNFGVSGPVPPEENLEQKPQHIDMHGDVFTLPDFTMNEIYKAIPKHCFERHTGIALAYIARDISAISSTVVLAYNLIPLLPFTLLRFAAYSCYTILAGILLTTLWTLAHESGHGALTPHKWLNTTIGFTIHSFLLVPYFSFQISHSRHHKATSDLERDTVFIPHSRESWLKSVHGEHADPHDVTFAHLSEDAPLISLFNCVLHQVIGWPLYLFDNAGGHRGKTGFPLYSHFWFGEDSALYKGKELIKVLWSDIGIAAMVGLLILAGRIFGCWTVLVYYGVPYLWLNHWVVLVTFLQHTDGKLPHYSRAKWTFARGASATIDRNAGILDRWFLHGAVSTHVCHHLVSTIPFYHAQEATLAIRGVLGPNYHRDDETPLLTAFWRNQRDCNFLEESTGMDGSGIFFFRNLHGRGTAPRDLAAAGEMLTSWPGSIAPAKDKEMVITLGLPRLRAQVSFGKRLLNTLWSDGDTNTALHRRRLSHVARS